MNQHKRCGVWSIECEREIGRESKRGVTVKSEEGSGEPQTEIGEERRRTFSERDETHLPKRALTVSHGKGLP